MKNIYYFGMIMLASLVLSSNLNAQTLNGTCNTSYQFCTGAIYNYPAGINTTAETGPDYGCLYTQPNPAWFYLEIAQPGDVALSIYSNPQRDLDFICWGPFVNPNNPCSSGLLTNGGNETSHWSSTDPHPANMGGYPSGNTVDCSYNSSWQEWCYIPNAQQGEYYIIMITNYSNQQCNVIFHQTNAGQPGAAVTVCGYAASVEGTVYYDFNDNLQQDAGEPGASGVITGSTSCLFYTMTDSAGHYLGHVCSTPDDFFAWCNQPYATVIPVSHYITASATGVDYAVQLIPNISDFSIDIIPNMTARPGFNYRLWVNLKNEGTINPNCGKLVIDVDTIFTLLSSTLQPDSAVNNHFVWNEICIDFFQSEQFNMLFKTDTAAILGVPYSVTGQVIVAGDINLSDNQVLVADTTIGSYDPNDKQVSPEGEISNAYAATSPEFVYTVRFQNTGTAPAVNVTIIDSLSQWLNPATLRIISSSHPCTPSMTGNGVLAFQFANIMLPDSGTSQEQSHGFVKFAVRCLPQLENGGEVFNTAAIYFDANPPVITNTVLTFTKPVMTAIPASKAGLFGLTADPNPASDIVTVKFNEVAAAGSILEIMNMQGRVVKTIAVQPKTDEMKINVSSLSKGVYMLRLNGQPDRTCRISVE
jgi:uncharacterized repeat protein (TIGR01451 family)